VIGVLLVSLPAAAHHSFAQFDTDREIEATGTVTEFEWSNPHSYVHLEVKGEKGDVEKWVAELTDLPMLVRAGWSKDVVKPGDRVTIHGYRARDGRTFMVIHTTTAAKLSKTRTTWAPLNPHAAKCSGRVTTDSYSRISGTESSNSNCLFKTANNTWRSAFVAQQLTGTIPIEHAKANG